jgi:hypothetical protein
MQRLYSGVVYASYNQLCFYDIDSDPDEVTADKFNNEDFAVRYKSNGSSICVSALGTNWLYWVEIFLANITPMFDEAERILALNLSIKSSILGIMNVTDGEIARMSLPNGDYIAYIFEFNLGDEDEDDIEDFDAYLQSIENRTDREYYKIVLVPGRTEKEGVIKGEQYLY